MTHHAPTRDTQQDVFLSDFTRNDTILLDTCHMGNTMLYFPYGNKEGKHDGRRTTPVAQRAWLEPVHTDEERETLSLCSEVEKGRGLHRHSGQLAKYHTRQGVEENSLCFVRADKKNNGLCRPAFRVRSIDWNPLNHTLSSIRLLVVCIIVCKIARYAYSSMACVGDQIL